MIKPNGIIAAMVTSLHEDETLNESEIRNQVNRQIEAGVDAVFCLGTNGEFYILREEEKLAVIRIVTDEVRGRVPVYAGTGCPGTKDTIALSPEGEGSWRGRSFDYQPLLCGDFAKGNPPSL